jgi:hypothetical protein
VRLDRIALGAACAAVLLAAPGGAALAGGPADAGPEACFSASEDGQRLRDEGKLIAARERFIACGREACPAVVRADCAGWLADVERRLPSIVLAAQGPDGRDLTGVRVTLDGAPLAAGVDGKAIGVDPGEHRVRFERDGGPPVEQRIVVREGDKLRKVSARFGDSPPAPAPAPPPDDGGVPVLPIALAGVAVAGGVAFAVLGLSAKGDADDLRATCAPRCAEADVDAARAKMIGADVALGVGALALGGAALAWLLRSPPREPPAAALLVTPALGGAAVGVTGRF